VEIHSHFYRGKNKQSVARVIILKQQSFRMLEYIWSLTEGKESDQLNDNNYNFLLVSCGLMGIDSVMCVHTKKIICFKIVIGCYYRPHIPTTKVSPFRRPISLFESMYVVLKPCL